MISFFHIGQQPVRINDLPRHPGHRLADRTIEILVQTGDNRDYREIIGVAVFAGYAEFTEMLSFTKESHPPVFLADIAATDQMYMVCPGET